MKSYKVKTTCNIYGVSYFCTNAHTPFDAAEKAENKLSWRAKEDMIKQEVLILDGSKQVWTFEKMEDEENE